MTCNTQNLVTSNTRTKNCSYILLLVYVYNTYLSPLEGCFMYIRWLLSRYLFKVVLYYEVVYYQKDTTKETSAFFFKFDKLCSFPLQLARGYSSATSHLEIICLIDSFWNPRSCPFKRISREIHYFFFTVQKCLRNTSSPTSIFVV